MFKLIFTFFAGAFVGIILMALIVAGGDDR